MRVSALQCEYVGPCCARHVRVFALLASSFGHHVFHRQPAAVADAVMVNFRRSFISLLSLLVGLRVASDDYVVPIRNYPLGSSHDYLIRIRTCFSVRVLRLASLKRFICLFLLFVFRSFHRIIFALFLSPSLSPKRGSLNPFSAPEPLLTLNPSNFVPKNGFPVVTGLSRFSSPLPTTVCAFLFIAEIISVVASSTCP